LRQKAQKGELSPYYRNDILYQTVFRLSRAIFAGFAAKRAKNAKFNLRAAFFADARFLQGFAVIAVFLAKIRPFQALRNVL
jgi:hypothetical protein